MFGKGIYFADCSSKSAQYCFIHRDSSSAFGYMLLCEVALGESIELLRSNSEMHENIHTMGKHSTKGCGKFHPKKESHIKVDNVHIPIGNIQHSEQYDESELLYNEYIVYNTSQVKCKYLVKIKFDFDDI